MAITNLRRTLPQAPLLRDTFNALKKQAGTVFTQTGIATLVAGTVTVSGVTLNAGSVITMSAATPGGTAGFLSAAVASRNATAGTFVITSSAGADTSTVNWRVETPMFHLDAYDQTVSAATAADLPTCAALAINIKRVYDGPLGAAQSSSFEGHRLAGGATLPVHQTQDTTNAVAVGDASLTGASPLLADVVALANDLKAKINAHFTQAGVHYQNDAVNTIATANATDLPSSITLLNAIKTALNAHIASAPNNTAPCIRMTEA